MLNPTKANEDRAALDLLICGFQVSRMLRLVADLGIADKIAKEGGCDVSELAKAWEVLPMQLLRVLRALAAFDIFHVTPNGYVTHSPRSLLLHPDTPNDLHYGARFWTVPGSWHAWGTVCGTHRWRTSPSCLEYEPLSVFARALAGCPDI